MCLCLCLLVCVPVSAPISLSLCRCVAYAFTRPYHTIRLACLRMHQLSSLLCAVLSTLPLPLSPPLSHFTPSFVLSLANAGQQGEPRRCKDCLWKRI